MSTAHCPFVAVDTKLAVNYLRRTTAVGYNASLRYKQQSAAYLMHSPLIYSPKPEQLLQVKRIFVIVKLVCKIILERHYVAAV